MGSRRYYVGYRVDTGRKAMFTSDATPTEATHGHLFAACVGPFRTRRGAAFFAGPIGPQVRCVDDAEYFAARQAANNPQGG